MRKIAVFVEGQSELIFVRELLKRKFNWNVDITCLKLYQKGQFEPAEYPNEVADAEFHYSIYNVGGDVEVLNEILLYEKSLWESGFEKIIGLRDMYSKTYRSFSNLIDPTINQKFIASHAQTINSTAQKPVNISFCFSIMEIEAWFLGRYECLEKVNQTLTPSFIKEKLGHELSEIDPELHFFHPASELESILYLVGEEYNKDKGIVESICSNWEEHDYNGLYGKNVCSSFNCFVDSLIIQ